MTVDFSAQPFARMTTLTPFTERTPRIVNAAKLLKAAGRKKSNKFLVEGENSVEAAIVTGAATDVFLTEAAAGRYEEILRSAINLEVFTHLITEKAARSLADTSTSPGIFALCRQGLWPANQVLGRKPQLVAVPVETSEPGNAGTLIRVADAVGADCCLFAGNAVDPLSPKVVRSTAGSLFHLPVAKDPNIAGVLDRLRAKNLTILATCADGEVSLDEADDLLAQPTAWLFGNEAHGLPADVLAAADHRVRIPIRGRAESLNLATASAICLYESAKAQAKAAEA